MDRKNHPPRQVTRPSPRNAPWKIFSSPHRPIVTRVKITIIPLITNLLTRIRTRLLTGTTIHTPMGTNTVTAMIIMNRNCAGISSSFLAGRSA